MARILITADLHLHPHRGDVKRVEDGLACLRWIYNTAKLAGIRKVVIAGDFVHHRFSLPVYAYSKACSAVSEALDSGIETIFLLGNHDCYHEDKCDINSLTPLSKWSQVIDKPSHICLGDPNVESDYVDFLPYTPTPSKHLGNPIFKSKVLISHLSIANAFLHAKFDIKSVEDDSKEKEVISPKAFAKWKKVWLGHYHYGQKVDDRLEYIGSPMQLTFGEAGQVKHVGIFDTESLKTDYVENTISPKFHIISDHRDLDAINVNDSYISMRLESIQGSSDLRNKLVKLGAREIELVPTNASNNVETKKALDNISAFFHNKAEMVEQYVKSLSLPENVDAIELTKIMRTIIES